MWVTIFPHNLHRCRLQPPGSLSNVSRMCQAFEPAKPKQSFNWHCTSITPILNPPKRCNKRKPSIPHETANPFWGTDDSRVVRSVGWISMGFQVRFFFWSSVNYKKINSDSRIVTVHPRSRCGASHRRRSEISSTPTPAKRDPFLSCRALFLVLQVREYYWRKVRKKIVDMQIVLDRFCSRRNNRSK